MAKKRKVVRLKEWQGMKVRYIDGSWLRSMKGSRLRFEARGHRAHEMYADSEIVRWSAMVYHPDESGIVGQTTTRGGKTPEQALELALKELTAKLRRAKVTVRERQLRLSKCIAHAGQGSG